MAMNLFGFANANQEYDIAVVGCGPAGLSAAVNASIRNKKVVVLGSEFCSPKLSKSPSVDNYLGLPGITGEELRRRFLDHAVAAGVPILNSRVDGITRDGEVFILSSRERLYTARAVILATGVSAARELPGEKKLLGRGVSYCATCDGPLFRGKTAVVIGYSPETEEEVRFLSELVSKLYFIPRYKEYDRAGIPDSVEIREERPVSIRGAGIVEAVETDKSTIRTDGVFVIKDAVAPDGLIQGLRVEGNAVLVDRAMRTNIEGVFAAGDCTGKPYQLAKATGEGQVAALSAVRYLDERERTNHWEALYAERKVV